MFLLFLIIFLFFIFNTKTLLFIYCMLPDRKNISCSSVCSVHELTSRNRFFILTKWPTLSSRGSCMYRLMCYRRWAVSEISSVPRCRRYWSTRCSDVRISLCSSETLCHQNSAPTYNVDTISSTCCSTDKAATTYHAKHALSVDCTLITAFFVITSRDNFT